MLFLCEKGSFFRFLGTKHVFLRNENEDCYFTFYVRHFFFL